MWIRLYQSDQRHALTTTIVDDTNHASSTLQAIHADTQISESISLDDFLFDFLVNAVEYVRDTTNGSTNGVWTFEPVDDGTQVADTVHIQIIHKASDASEFSVTQLHDCIVAPDMILQLHDTIVRIHHVAAAMNAAHNCYRIRNGETAIRWVDDTRSVECPGYEAFLEQLVGLIEMPVPIRPSGIFVHGCGGVGKSTVVKYLLTSQHSDIVYRRVSRNPFRVPSLNDGAIYLVDDLNIILKDKEQNVSHMEIAMNQGLMMVAFGSDLPPAAFLSAGRLEVILELLPPTQTQRETILSRILPEAHSSWIPNLAQLTAGCVAADLVQLKLVVGDDYQSYAEAAYSLVPSQMAALDVQKPAMLTEKAQALTEKELFIKSFRDFVGYDEAKQRMFRAVVLPWTRHLKGVAKGIIDLPAGVLFHGPSGCGKTIAAKCLGSALGLSMIQVRATDVLDQFVGGSEAVVRAMFSRARQAAPCILFLDEIDSLASNREENSTGVMSRVLSTMLNEMDGISSGAGGQNVLIVACTNRLDAIDSAMLRPGRLEVHIPLQKPSPLDIEAILRSKLKSVDLDANLQPIVTRLTNSRVTGADVYGICREAVFHSLRRSKDRPLKLTDEDFESALIRTGIAP